MKLEPELEYKAWHTPSKQLIFNIREETTSISLNDIPLHAKEIKAHVYIQCGNLPQNTYIIWYFSTLFDVAKIQCYLYGQNAISFSNEIITLEINDQRNINIKREGIHPYPYFALTFEILLYR